MFKDKTITVKGHTYAITAMTKGRADPKRGGRWMYGVWKDVPRGSGNSSRWFMSKTALMNAYPSLKGRLVGWP